MGRSPPRRSLNCKTLLTMRTFGLMHFDRIEAVKTTFNRHRAAAIENAGLSNAAAGGGPKTRPPQSPGVGKATVDAVAIGVKCSARAVT